MKDMQGANDETGRDGNTAVYYHVNRAGWSLDMLSRSVSWG